MKSLLIYLKNYKKEAVLAPLFKMLEATFELIVPLVMAAVIDTGIGNGDRTYVIHMCLVLILLGIVGLVSSITAQYFAAKAATGFATELRHAFFAHVQQLSFAQMDTIGTDTLITRMTSDINQAQSGVNMVLRLFLRSPFIVLGAMIMAFTVDAKAAMVFVVTIPLLSVIVFGIMMVTMPMYKKVQSYLDQVLQTTRENLTGARVIRAFHREDQEREQFENRNEQLASAQKFVGRISGLMNPLTYVTINFAIIVLIYVGALRVNSGALTQGAVVALLNYMSQILVELIKLANLIVTVTRAAASGNRVADVLAIDPDMKEEAKMQGTDAGTAQNSGTADAVSGQSALVEFDHVCLTYPGGGDPALQDISFAAYPGQTIGIIGGTGSGKSSLVNLIPRFYDVTGGSVRVHGQDVRTQSMNGLRSRIGMVFQKSELFKGSIEENLRWGNRQAAQQDLEDALMASQAKEFVDSKPGRLSFRIEQSGRNLSGGQKQRLTIARALVRKPEVLILDDSASALDFATDAKLRMAIRQMHHQMTIFIVSQRAASIREADQILVLDEGRLVGSGTHEELLRDNAVYQEIYYSQFPKEEDHAE
ncbi:MAG: ABC transporter ATP-binding protein/permease [Butyrivibrio sp.]|jgi:ABC-type multidrug transport system fused ATPase/permease subunit|nr:ABC transporter ATP-binding protein/permease [Butyrivibrio sp.]